MTTEQQVPEIVLTVENLEELATAMKAIPGTLEMVSEFIAKEFTDVDGNLAEVPGTIETSLMALAVLAVALEMTAKNLDMMAAELAERERGVYVCKKEKIT